MSNPIGGFPREGFFNCVWICSVRMSIFCPIDCARVTISSTLFGHISWWALELDFWLMFAFFFLGVGFMSMRCPQSIAELCFEFLLLLMGPLENATLGITIIRHVYPSRRKDISGYIFVASCFRCAISSISTSLSILRTNCTSNSSDIRLNDAATWGLFISWLGEWWNRMIDFALSIFNQCVFFKRTLCTIFILF